MVFIIQNLQLITNLNNKMENNVLTQLKIDNYILMQNTDSTSILKIHRLLLHFFLNIKNKNIDAKTIQVTMHRKYGLNII